MSRVSCQKEENPERKKIEKTYFQKKNSQDFLPYKKFSQDFLPSTINPGYGGVYKVYGKSRLQGFKKCYGGS